MRIFKGDTRGTPCRTLHHLRGCVSAERKKRTKRLIEVGAAVESVLKQPIEKEDLPKLINFLEQQEERGNYFSKAMK